MVTLTVGGQNFDATSLISFEQSNLSNVLQAIIEQLKTLKESNDNLTKDVNSLNTTNNELNEKNKVLTDDVSALKVEVKQLKEFKDKQEENSQKLESKIEENNNLIEKLKTDIENTNNELKKEMEKKSANNGNQSSENGNENDTVQGSALSSPMDELKENFDELKTKVDNIENTTEKLNNEVNSSIPKIFEQYNAITKLQNISKQLYEKQQEISHAIEKFHGDDAVPSSTKDDENNNNNDSNNNLQFDTMTKPSEKAAPESIFTTTTTQFDTNYEEKLENMDQAYNDRCSMLEAALHTLQIDMEKLQEVFNNLDDKQENKLKLNGLNKRSKSMSSKGGRRDDKNSDADANGDDDEEDVNLNTMKDINTGALSARDSATGGGGQSPSLAGHLVVTGGRSSFSNVVSASGDLSISLSLTQLKSTVDNNHAQFEMETSKTNAIISALRPIVKKLEKDVQMLKTKTGNGNINGNDNGNNGKGKDGENDENEMNSNMVDIVSKLGDDVECQLNDLQLSTNKNLEGLQIDLKKLESRLQTHVNKLQTLINRKIDRNTLEFGMNSLQSTLQAQIIELSTKIDANNNTNNNNNNTNNRNIHSSRSHRSAASNGEYIEKRVIRTGGSDSVHIELRQVSRVGTASSRDRDNINDSSNNNNVLMIDQDQDQDHDKDIQLAVIKPDYSMHDARFIADIQNKADLADVQALQNELFDIRATIQKLQLWSHGSESTPKNSMSTTNKSEQKREKHEKHATFAPSATTKKVENEILRHFDLIKGLETMVLSNDQSIKRLFLKIEKTAQNTEFSDLHSTNPTNLSEVSNLLTSHKKWIVKNSDDVTELRKKMNSLNDMCHEIGGDGSGLSPNSKKRNSNNRWNKGQSLFDINNNKNNNNNKQLPTLTEAANMTDKNGKSLIDIINDLSHEITKKANRTEIRNKVGRKEVQDLLNATSDLWIGPAETAYFSGKPLEFWKCMSCDRPTNLNRTVENRHITPSFPVSVAPRASTSRSYVSRYSNVTGYFNNTSNTNGATGAGTTGGAHSGSSGVHTYATRSSQYGAPQLKTSRLPKLLQNYTFGNTQGSPTNNSIQTGVNHGGGNGHNGNGNSNGNGDHVDAQIQPPQSKMSNNERVVIP